MEKKEEENLRKEKVTEKVIKDLYQFDKKQFNQNRKFMEHEIPLSEVFDYSEHSNSFKSVYSIDELLDEIENETLFLLLKKTDYKTLQILSLRIEGYTNKEISSILNISESVIRQRICRLRKIVRNIL